MYKSKLVKKVLFTQKEIENKTKEVGKQISEYYNNRPFVMIGLLKGSVPFLAQLIKSIENDYAELEFMNVSSYSGTTSTGEIKILKDLDTSVKGKEVLIIEDIIDTGITLNSVKKILLQRGAKDVKIVTMLNKPARRVKKIEPEWQCFEIEDYFVIGYGLDINEKARNLPYIAICDTDAIYEVTSVK